MPLSLNTNIEKDVNGKPRSKAQILAITMARKNKPEKKPTKPKKYG